MNKEQRAMVVEYTSTLSDEDVRYLSLRLHERLGDDLAEALNMMSRNEKMDVMLMSTNDAFELFEMLDKIRDVAGKECKRRGVSLKTGT